MPWSAETEGDALAEGAILHIDRGYSDSVPQNGSAIAVLHRPSQRSTAVTVVSAAADRLEVSDGHRHFTLKPHAATKPNVVDPDGRARESWIVT